MLAVKLSYPFCFSLLNIECVTGVNFLQDGNRGLGDVVITCTTPRVLTNARAPPMQRHVLEQLFITDQKVGFGHASLL